MFIISHIFFIFFVSLAGTLALTMSKFYLIYCISDAYFIWEPGISYT